MTDCVIEIDLTVPVAGGGTAPATGYIQFRPTKRRDLEGEIVLPESFNVALVDGAAEVTLAPTVDGDWCWRATERISKGRNWYFNVPDGPGPVDYDDLEEVDKDTLNPSAPIVPVWKGYIDAGDAALQAQIDAIEASDVESVAGLNGAVSASALKTALNLPADTAGDLLNEVAVRLAADDLLDGRLDTIEADYATAVDITNEATARDTAIATEATLARNADNLTSGTVADARIPSSIARDSEVTSAVSAEATARDSAISTAVATEAALARNADNLTSGTVADARIASTIARDTEVTAAVAAEATLARNGDNITSGTVADARIASTITRDSEVTTLVATELASYQPGLEIGYAERTTSATSTQTVANATGTISGLSVTVTGTGRAVDIRFAAALAWQSTANKLVFTSLMVNGGAGGAAHGSSSTLTTTGPGQTWTRRMVLTNGVSYTFAVAVYTESGGGTATVFANSTYPMSLSVTNR